MKNVALIQFNGMQRRLTKAESIEMALVEETRVLDALEYVKKQYPQMTLREGALLVLLNQELVSLDSLLSPGDTLTFLPYVAGG